MTGSEQGKHPPSTGGVTEGDAAYDRCWVGKGGGGGTEGVAVYGRRQQGNCALYAFGDTKWLAVPTTDSANAKPLITIVQKLLY